MHRLQPGFLSAAAIALVFIGTGCGNKAATNTASTTGNNDEALANAIKSKLYSDSSIKGAPINVDVKDGNATLSGDVPNSDVELQAMKVANGVAGVQKVNDKLKVNSTMASNPSSSNSNPAPASTAVSTAPPVRPATRPAPSQADAPPPSPVTHHSATYTIPSGDRVAVRMTEGVDSSKDRMGQTFRASLEAPLTANGRVVIPSGAPATVKLTDVSKAGRVRGKNEITLQLASIEYGGKTYEIDSSSFADEGKGKGKQTAIRSGIGAAAGALIGGLAGGGKGAGIGAAAGGGGMLGYQLFTHGSKVKIPSETVVNFRLESPLTVTKSGRRNSSEE